MDREKVINMDTSRSAMIKKLQNYFESVDELVGVDNVRRADNDVFEFLVKLADNFTSSTRKKEIGWQITAMPGDPFYYFLKVHNAEGIAIGLILKRNKEGKWETEALTKPIE